MIADEASVCQRLRKSRCLGPAGAEQLQGIDPKAVLDGDTFYLSVRLHELDLDRLDEQLYGGPGLDEFRDRRRDEPDLRRQRRLLVRVLRLKGRSRRRDRDGITSELPTSGWSS